MRSFDADVDGFLHRAVIEQFDENGEFVTRLYFGPYTDKKTAQSQVTRETKPGRVQFRDPKRYGGAVTKWGWSAKGWTESTKLEWVVDTD